MTIQDSNREKLENTLHKNKSEYNNFTEANTGNKNSLKKQHSELGDLNKDSGLEDSDIFYDSFAMFTLLFLLSNFSLLSFSFIFI